MIKKMLLLVLSITLLTVVVVGLSGCDLEAKANVAPPVLEEELNHEVLSDLEDLPLSDATPEQEVEIEENQVAPATEAELPEQNEVEVDEVADVAVEPAKKAIATTNLTLEDAKAIFKQNYPNATIDIAKTEGNAYYIEGRENSDICKMKILASDGSILLNKRITTSRGNNQGQGNSSHQNDNVSSSDTVADSPVQSTSYTLEDAKSKFTEQYPNATINIAKAEGDAFYVEGTDGNDICKLKVLTDGTIVLNKRITTGSNNRGNNYGNNSGNNYNNRGNNNGYGR